jgi:carbohydrate-binding DOMON domain-containing protein
MSQATAVVAGTVQASTGVPGESPLVELLSAVYNATNFLIEPALSVPSSPTSITLPGSPVKIAYIQNNHATQTLTVTWTPNGGASAVIVTLQPGEFIVLGGQTGASGGITALSLQGSGASTTAKLILAQ